MIKYKNVVHIIGEDSFEQGLQPAVTSLTVKNECICVYALCSVCTVGPTAPPLRPPFYVSGFRLNSHTVW